MRNYDEKNLFFFHIHSGLGVKDVFRSLIFIQVLGVKDVLFAGGSSANGKNIRILTR